MSDTQILAMAVTFTTAFLAVLIGVLLNNSRLGDVKDAITQRMEVRIAELRMVIEKNHSETLMKFAGIEGRLTRIESERRIVH
jgi:hypothetical protein